MISEALLKERSEIIDQLTREYIASHGRPSQNMWAGIEYPPDAWLDETLKNQGEHWTIETLRARAPKGLHPDWRHLSMKQREALAAFGKRIPGGVYFYVYAVSNSLEAIAYGMEIWNAIGTGGKNGSYAQWGGSVQPIPTGLIISTARGIPTQSPPSSVSLDLSITLSGVGMPNVMGQDYAPMDANRATVTLVVGVKPDFF